MSVILLIFLGVIIGVILMGIFLFFCYAIIKEIILKNGVQIKNKIEKEIRILKEATEEGSSIVFPDQSKEIFNNDNSNIKDLLD